VNSSPSGCKGAPQHPLREIWLAAAAGRFPAVDGGYTFVPPFEPGLEGVVSFTGHAFLATDLDDSSFAGLALDGFGAALHPSVLQRISGPRGVVGVQDATLVGFGRGGGGLPLRTDCDEHARVRYAQQVRHELRVYGDDRGLVTLGLGHAGRTEISVEASGGGGSGSGRALIADALALTPPGEPVFAAVSPGNARSLRAFLAAGFTPLGGEMWIKPAREDVGDQ
jgi:hypothetical protein